MPEQKIVTAEDMARVTQFDLQFKVPTQPRFPQELVAVPLADGILFDGTDEQQVLRGQATKTLLPRLLPLLDGTRSQDQLEAELPDVPAGHLGKAIALLYTRGLLEDGAEEPDLDPGRCDAQTLAFFRRHVDVTRVNRNALQALDRLRRSRVTVCAVGPHQTAARNLIAKQLRQAGVGAVHCGELGSDLGSLTAADEIGNWLVVVLVEGQDDHDQLLALDAQCARLGIPWLRAAIWAEKLTADLGPYFERGETACYRCFARAEARPQNCAARNPVGVEIGSSWLHTRLWANMLVTEVIYLLSRIAPAATGLHTSRYDLSDWSRQRLRFPKLPGCGHCRPLPATDGQRGRDSSPEVGMISPALVYEDGVAFPSRHLIDPKSHQVHYRVSNIELARDGKRYPSAVKVSLPTLSHLPQLRGGTLDHLSGGPDLQRATNRLGIENLASLLMLSAGIRGEAVESSKVRRWTATGGNLGSVELYVAVRDVEGLEPGFYFYQPHEHLLARLGAAMRPGEVADFIQRAAPRQEYDTPDALIILVGALHRVAQKYGPFAYRIINLDAGVALGQMHLVGSSLGLSTRTAQRWADDLIAADLNLTDLSEAVTGALFVRGAHSVGQED